MSETIRYARIGKEDINLGTGTFEVRLADGRVVTLQQVDIGELLSDASVSTRDITLDSLTVTTLTVSGTATPSGTLRVPEKADPGSPVSGELWINSGGLVLEYSDDAGTPAAHVLVAEDTTQTLTAKTLTSPALTTPVVTGNVTGTYALAGTPSLGAPLDVSDEDLTSIDEAHFADAAANPTAAGRLRRNSANLVWHDGTSAKIVVLRDAIQTLTGKTLDTPVFSGTITGTYTLAGTVTLTSPTINSGTLSGAVITGAAPSTPTANTVYTESIMKGWVRFSVTGTIAADLNVSSITDTGAGDWTVNWATAFGSNNYAASFSVNQTSTSSSGYVFALGAMAAGSLQVTTAVTNTLTDPDGYLCVMAIGNQ